MLHYDFNTIKFSPYTSVIMNPNPYAHTTDFWKITYAIEGKSEQVTDGIKRTLTQHTVLIVKPDAIHQNLNFSGPTYKHRDIYVSDEKMWEICSHFPSGTYNRLCKTTPFFRFSPISFNYLETMLNSFPVNSEIKNDYLDGIHFTIVANVIALFLECFASSYNKPEWIINLASRTNDAEYLQNTVAHLISDIPYSHGYICREFKKYYGVTLSEYLIKAKIIHSSNLLMNKNLSIINIAYMLGFSTQSSFIKSFKRYFDVSPGKFRKTNLSKSTIGTTSIWGKSNPRSL